MSARHYVSYSKFLFKIVCLCLCPSADQELQIKCGKDRKKRIQFCRAIPALDDRDRGLAQAGPFGQIRLRPITLIVGALDDAANLLWCVGGGR